MSKVRDINVAFVSGVYTKRIKRDDGTQFSKSHIEELMKAVKKVQLLYKEPIKQVNQQCMRLFLLVSSIPILESVECTSY